MKDGRYRNLWPVPGGAGAYLENLNVILRQVDGHHNRQAIEKRLRKRLIAPGCKQAKTLRGYVAVPISIGLVESEAHGGPLVLTTLGRRFARGDVGALRAGLVRSIEGVAEILELLGQHEVLTFNELGRGLNDLGLTWGYPMALRYRLWWLRAADAISATRDSRVDRWRLTSAGRRELHKLPAQ